MVKNVLLIKYGEIFIRGKNRYKFLDQLANIILRRLGKGHRLIREQTRFVIEADDLDYAVNKLKNISGITSICIATKTDDLSIENLREISIEHMLRNYSGVSYKVDTRRSNKKYPLDSVQISADIGGYILNNSESFSVNVKNPDVVLKVELRTCAYIYSKEIKGVSGLPYASSGKAVLLLSGGIDSPVAGYLMSLRGVECEAVYFNSPPYTSRNSVNKVKDLCEKLSEFTGEISLNIVNFTELMLYLKAKVPDDKLTIFLKRSMLRASEIIADRKNASALIVGDSVGQVASQTLKAITAIDSAVNIPILRPLCAYGKNDIINLAKEIETYEISIRPFNDCCTVFVPKHPDLTPKIETIQKINTELTELDELIQKAVDEAEYLEIKE